MDQSISFADALPAEEPVVIFGLAMLIFLAAPLVLGRYGLPGIVGIVLSGVLVGPGGLGILERGEAFVILGEVGLVYLMFIAALEVNLRQFLERKERSVLFGLLSFGIPQALGMLVGFYLLDLALVSAVLFGAIFSSHTLIAYPVVNRLGVSGDDAMTTTIGGTIITDTLALLVLTVVIVATAGGLEPSFLTRLLVGLIALFLGVWFLVPRIGRWFFRGFEQESYFEFLFVMAVLFIAAVLAEIIGVKHIIGAFLAGLALNRLVPPTGPLMNRIEFAGNAVFIPFFLLSMGMLVDLRALVAGVDTLLLTGTLISLTVLSKLVASWITGRFYGYSPPQRLGMYGLSLGQAAAALAIVLIGFQEGVPGFDQTMLNAVVLLILFSSVVSPALVQRAGRRLVESQSARGRARGEAPQRILLPIPKEVERLDRLLDFALLLREPGSEQPINMVTVLPPHSSVAAEVAEAEEAFVEAEKYVAGAEVASSGQARLEQHPADGIIRTVVENRISTILLPWDGLHSGDERAFGSVIDRVLADTRQLVLVTRLAEPLEAIARLVVVLPPGIDQTPGFFEAVHRIEVMAEKLEAGILSLAVGGAPSVYEHLFARIPPPTAAGFEPVDSWASLDRRLGEVSKGDLVLCVSARKGQAGFSRQLQTLPSTVAGNVRHGFTFLFPALTPWGDDRRFLQIS